MYIFITHFFTEYVIFKYLLQYNLLNKLYSAIFQIIRTPRKFSSFAGYLSSIFIIQHYL